jgi:hypothetical protein
MSRGFESNENFSDGNAANGIQTTTKVQIIKQGVQIRKEVP